MEYLTMTIREQKNIALIAHDGKNRKCYNGASKIGRSSKNITCVGLERLPG